MKLLFWPSAVTMCLIRVACTGASGGGQDGRIHQSGWWFKGSPVLSVSHFLSSIHLPVNPGSLYPLPSPHLSALLVMFAVPDLPWTLSLSRCPAGMRDSQQTNQMTGVLLGSGILDLDQHPGQAGDWGSR